MTDLHLRAGLYVFSVAASILALWMGGGSIGLLIIVAFICAFAGAAGKIPNIISVIARIAKMVSR
ncbi:MAG: hypothetical protein ABIL01_31115 [Pseudomonadota bacterium]